MTLVGEGFRLDPAERADLVTSQPAAAPLLRPYIIGRDLVQRREERFVIDAFGLTEAELRVQFPAVYQILANRVRPVREQNNRKIYRDRWWIYAEPRSELRRASAGISRYIATCRTAKFRIFNFEDVATLPDAKIVAVTLDDAFFAGVLTSKIHQVFAFRIGGWLGVGNDSNYNHSDCFGKFPFPADVPEPLKDRICGEAEALDALRKCVLAAHDDLTLTGLYNVLELLRAGTPLNDKDLDVHDRGLVTIIRQHHDAIDALVAEAYGWGADHAAGTLTDVEILTRLVALNAARAAEEARGIIRWLRPAYQAPNEAPKTTGNLDLGETSVLPASAIIIPWPKTLPEQVSAVAGLLQGATTPLHPRDVARAFKAKQASSMTPVLDTLTAIGMARKLADGRYAA